LLASARIVLTHAFEGGHPDHDAAAFAVHAVVKFLSQRGRSPQVIEMPFYRADGPGWARQTFPPEQARSIVVLTPEEQNLKRRMIECYASQSQTLAPFALDRECFRAAPPCDFSMLPNGGALLYERYDWGMNGARWCELAEAARTGLDLEWPI
jgi:N-acetylglucosamine malate deacetylase 2